jgi:hypothetical protein
MRAASKSSGVPYCICETNSFSGGVRSGVSDTFGAALSATLRERECDPGSLFLRRVVIVKLQGSS